MRDVRRGLVLFVALVAGRPAAAAEGPVLLAEEAEGAVEVSGERRLAVEGLRGEISVVAGEPGKLAFSSRMGGAAESPLPVALWLEGDAFRMVRPAGARDVPSVITLWVPPSMRVVLRTSGSAVYVKGVAGAVDLSGPGNRLEVYGAAGTVSAEMEGGSVVAGSGTGGLAIRGRDLNVRLDATGGTAALRVSKGAVTVSAARGDFDGEFEGVDVQVDQALGSFRLQLRGGRASLKGLKRGADLSAAGAPLKVEGSKGTFAVESDSMVELRDVEGAVHVMAYGGAVRASTIKGSIDVKSTGAEEVAIESVSGAVSVEGPGLRTKLSDLGGEVTVRTSSGPIEVANAAGPLTIDSDTGKVDLKQIAGAVKVTSRASDVTLTDSPGPVTIDADGGQVDVTWSSIGVTADSSIRNEGGGVSVEFPGSGGCRVEAEAKYGRVQVDGLPGVTVADGGARASGLVRRQSRPLLRIAANGDIVLTGKGGGD